ncbi:sugar-binding transcriptional regulator [Thermoanaerobacterium sp. DL9XJH110]|uniref:sugar-binding transcriptional regulator n=1 Tax=Thermoanaerobacterium sp. DL9XJH110 TaxID=3386643 RepID=UPI003BB4EEBF
MEDVVELLKKIAPETVQAIEDRYTILRNIYFNQPIGRRALSAILSWSERSLRTEVKRLEELGLIEVDAKGMKVSSTGENLISGLEGFFFYLKGLKTVEENIKQRFHCGNVIIVPGNSDEDETIKKQLGKEAAAFLKASLKNGDVVAVTGGTTMAQVPRNLSPVSGFEDVIVVPGRGGLGERVEIQSNTIAAELAAKLGAQYRLLYVPDNLGDKAMESIVREPGIREVIDIIRRADILLHGIGGAEEMARRRGLPEEEIVAIKKTGAVAEAFGFYFNKNGEIVYTTTSVGLSIKDLKNIRVVIAIAGGASKAPAIQAFLKYHLPTVLITDEGAARRLLELEGGE